MADDAQNDTEMEGTEELNQNQEEESEERDSTDGSEDEHESELELKIAALTKQISQNPYVYDNHIEKIKALRELGDLHRLRDAREEMSKHFPLTEELWLEWLHDEIPLASDENERKKIEKLFEKSFDDYQSVPVWLEYVQFAIGRMGEKEGLVTVRNAFEQALTAVGLHVSLGSNIWEAYREFENALLAGLMPQPGAVVTKEEEEAFAIQNQRVITLFKRQLAVPLLHMQDTLKEYKDWLGQDDIDPDTQAAFSKALQTVNSVQSLEDKLLTSEAPHLEAYQEYIAHELKTEDPARIQCIFERALKDNCLNAELWMQYTAYLDKLKFKQQITSAYERALRNCPWSSVLWVKYLLAMERQNTSFNTMKELAEKALLAGFSHSGDYLAVWCQYCDYLRRRIDWEQDHEETLETFQLTIERAIDFMFENYGKDGDPEAILQQFWAVIEAKYCKNLEKAREIWNQVMQAGHGSEAALWLQYYRLERMYGDNKHCRRILQKALNSVTDWPESITQAYINFEREEGNLEQYDTAVTKCEAQMERINERRAKTRRNHKNMDLVMARWKTNMSISKRLLKTLTLPRKLKGRYCNSFFLSHAVKFLSWITSTAQWRPCIPYTQVSDEPPSKRLKEDISLYIPDSHQSGEGLGQFHGQSVRHDPSKDNVTAFISNLDFSLEEERLKEVFQKCGEIVNIRLVRNYKGKSKGFGYVEFTDSNAVLQALKLDREFVDGRPMFVSRCEDRTVAKQPPQFKFPTQLEKNKLFVKGLPFTVTKEDVEAIFKEHGKIKEIRMVTYRNGSPKGIAYVEYEDEQSAGQAVLKTDGLVIGEHTVSVAISNPPERKTPLSTRMAAPVGRVPNLGSGKKETDFRGKARTQVSLLPRALRQQAVPGNSTTTLGAKDGALSEKTSDKPAMNNADFRAMLLKK
ncbi:unnamed protein product [Lymnaea stagnalis]|uniref:RRM domain-containing protein n=1 Tax=Lymnaea stagnalis TaxID=6523 RepID=A0AAV2ICS2_LYMST